MAGQPLHPDLSQSWQPSLYASGIVTYTAATIAVILRFIARRLTRSHLWYDDWLVVMAWLAATGWFIDAWIWIRLGLGVHYQAIPTAYDKIIHSAFLNLFIEEIFYSTATGFMKLSLLAFYWRLFNISNIRVAIRIMITCVIAWLVARYIAIILHCIPVAAYWDKTIPNATCHVNDRLFFMGTNTTNFILDAITYMLPMPYVQKLQVQRSQKNGVFVMFTLGTFIVGVSIALIVVCFRLDNTSPDFTWNISPVIVWAGCEINLGVVTACLPSLRPIFLLVKTGNAKPHEAKNSRQFDDSLVLKRDRGVTTFVSKGRNAKSFYVADTKDEQHHPFSVIQDDGHSIYNYDGVNHSPNGRSNVELGYIRPPRDKVMVRDDIYVKISDA